MQPNRFDVKSQTQGRWRGLLASLGLNDRQLSGKSTECPICRNGPKSDRFRFDDKDGRGTWYCAACGAGDGVRLVEKIRGVDFKGALEILEPLCGSVRFEAPKAKGSDEILTEARDEMTTLWRSAMPLSGHCLASRYLRSRKLERLSWGSLVACVRFVEELPYFEEGGVKRMLPAMLAKYVAPDLKSAILHRTWLQEPGLKADVATPRKMWRGRVPEGGAVRLAPAAETMGVGEGLETCLSAADEAGVPVWSCLSADALVRFQPPPECKHLIIFGDNDSSFKGQYAAYGLAHRLVLAPADRRVTVEVRLPSYWDVGEKCDWNDLRQRGAA